MSTILLTLHEEHKARQSRLKAAALKAVTAPPKPPIPEEPKPPEPEPEPVPEPALSKSINTFEIVLFEICRYYNVNRLDILSDRRKKHMVAARHMLGYLLYRITTMTTYQIAPRMGRDVTTILYGIKCINKHIAEHNEAIIELERRINLAFEQRKAIFIS